MKEIELRPCPFCGGKAKLSTFVTTSGAQHRCAAYCECEKCGAEIKSCVDTGGDGKFLFEAINDWNTRKGEKDELD